MRTGIYMVLTVCCLPTDFVLAQNMQRGKEQNTAIQASDRVEALLQILQTDRKEDRRAEAAEELGKYSSQEFPEIISGLIDALVRDGSAGVRKTAVKTLADLEPRTHEIKDALEQAIKQDKSWSVRQTARIAAWRYKPSDAPPPTAVPKVRNSSKATSNGKVAREHTPKQKAKPASDPLKESAPPVIVPMVPADSAPPAPVMAPGPGRFNRPPVVVPAGGPTRLAAPRPPG